jgi:hypothetical protein
MQRTQNISSMNPRLDTCWDGCSYSARCDKETVSTCQICGHRIVEMSARVGSGNGIDPFARRRSACPPHPTRGTSDMRDSFYRFGVETSSWRLRLYSAERIKCAQDHTRLFRTQASAHATTPADPARADRPPDYGCRGAQPWPAMKGRFASAHISWTACRPESSVKGTPPPGSTHCPAR